MSLTMNPSVAWRKVTYLLCNYRWFSCTSRNVVESEPVCANCIILPPPWESIISYTASVHGLLIFLTGNVAFHTQDPKQCSWASIRDVVFISMGFGLGLGFPKTVFFLVSFDKHLYERKSHFAIPLFLLKEVLHASSCFPQVLLLYSILFCSYCLEFNGCEY